MSRRNGGGVEPRRWHVATTVAILALSVVTALSGLLRPGHYADPAGLVELYRVQDLTILAVGVPVLAVGLLAAMRGSLRGRVVWLGGLAFMTYIWMSVGLQVSFNAFFLVYVALFSLSLFTLVGGLVTTDAGAVARSLRGRVSTRLYAGFLAVIAVGLTVLWLSDIVPALLGGTVPLSVGEAGEQTLVSHFVDLSVVVPSIAVAAVGLLRERDWGYLLAGVALVLGGTLAAPIGLTTVVVATGDVLSVSPLQLAATVLPILVAAVLAVTYVRSMASPDGGP